MKSMKKYEKQGDINDGTKMGFRLFSPVSLSVSDDAKVLQRLLHCIKWWGFVKQEAVILPYFGRKSKTVVENTVSSQVFAKCKP